MPRAITIRAVRCLVLLATLSATNVLALPGDGVTPVVELRTGLEEISLEGHFAYLVDPDGRLEIEDVSQPAFSQRFVPVTKDHLEFGYTDSAIWITFALSDPEPDGADWLLEIDYPLLDRIDVFRENLAGGWESVRLGDSLPFGSRPLDYRNFLLPVTHGDVRPRRYFVRFQTRSSMQVRPTLHARETFFQGEIGSEFAFGVIYGVMLLMVIYNGFLYLAVKDVSYLVYVLSVLAGTMFVMAYNGHAYQYLWPGQPGWANIVVPLSSALWMVGTALFTQLFLETRRYAPTIRKWINGLLVLAVIAVFMALFADYRYSIRVSTTLGLVNVLLILVAGIVSWWRGNRAARFFTLAWLVYAIGTGMLILSRLGVLPDNFFTHNAVALGLLTEVVFLSFALSDKYRLMTEQLAGHSRDLEREVEARTADLREANRRLEEVSLIDPLTQLANRRRFDAVLAEEWDRHHRQGESLSLVLIDVDDFKGYNDHFGHLQGDECLRQVSAKIAEVLHRPGDMAARFGGDEFAAILPDTPPDGAEAVATQILESVRGLALEHVPGSGSGFVTLSIGVASVVPGKGQDPDDLFRASDQALYVSKEQGRNRVSVFGATGPVPDDGSPPATTVSTSPS